MKRPWSFAGLTGLLATVVGCATIVHRGGKQWVTITSTPTGATATIDGFTKIQTPGQIKLKRGKDHIVVIEKEGYQPAQAFIDHDFSGWVIGNVLFGGLIGIAVDFGTGGAYNLEPDTLNLPLQATSAPPEPAPSAPSTPSAPGS